jgi:hypothetical protein
MTFESNTPYFEMYTPEGDIAVQALVNVAKAGRLTWPETYALLEKLSQDAKYGEATDTAVRECVYSALGFKTAFYC